MFEIVFEVLQVLGLCGILALFITSDKNVRFDRRGYLYILIGQLLVIFGSVMDVLDNFEAGRGGVFVGDTAIRFALENVVGYLGGFVVLAIGFWKWLPSLGTLDAEHDELEKKRNELEADVLKRTSELERERERRECLESAMNVADEWRTALYDRSPVPIAHGLIGGEKVDRNEAFAHMLGYESRGELMAATAHDPCTVWANRDELERLMELMRTESRYSGFVGTLLGKGGEPVSVIFDFTTLADSAGQNYYFYAFAKKAADADSSNALSESEKRLRIIMDSMPAGLYLVETETQMIADVNVGMLALTGYGREELVGHHCCDRMCPSEKGTCPIIDQGTEIFCAERKIRKKDGSDLPVVKTVAPVVLGGKRYLLEAVVDISEQKRLEDFKQDVDRIVAHDLKTPIIGVINACRVLLMDKEDIDDETREMLELIQRQGKRVLKMIGMSLSVYKMEAGSFPYDPEPLDFLKVMGDVCLEVAGAARLKNVTVSLLVDGHEPQEGEGLVVPGNELLFETMVTNLLNNAVEASPFGGTVTVALESCDPMTMTISNAGAVPEDVRDTFFEKYATSGKPTGTGVGTYSAMLVAKTVGGNLAMETSSRDNRTVVTLTLPCS